MSSALLPVSFAQTKIQPPRPRTGLVARPRLVDLLHDALATRRLTVLQAPAGWGKTSALTQWLAAHPTGQAVAWIAADDDDDLPRFIACLSAALEPFDLAWRVSPQALPALALAERGQRRAADEIANALASAETARGLIVVDDVHRIKDAQVFDFLRLLLESLPAPHWGVALSTRQMPDLPLARWRALGELAEFRQDDLCFGEHDVAALLAANGADADGAGELARRTGGWVAGLRLLLSVGAGKPLATASSQRHIFEYLADEVLSAMDAELRGFLLRCAVLHELTPARCAHVAQQPRAAALLERIEREGLFVSRLDAEEHTLRLHDLFRDFLEDRLLREHAPELPALLRRAAEHESDLARAIGWLARAGAWDEAAQVLAQRGPAVVPLGGGPTVVRLLELFPPHERHSRPELQQLRGLCAYQQFDFEELLPSMNSAAAGFAAAGQSEAAALARISAAIGMRNSGRQDEARAAFRQLAAEPLTGTPAALRAYFTAWEAYACHEPDSVAPAFAQALDWLATTHDTQFWERCFLHCFLVGLPGMAPLVARFDACAMRMVHDTPSLLRSGVLHARAATAMGEGDLARAAEWLAAADDDVRWLGSPRAPVTENYMLHLVLDALRGDREAVLLHAQRMQADMQGSGEANRRTHHSSALLTEARAWWILGDDARVRALAHAMTLARNSYEWRYAEAEHAMVHGMAALGAGHDEEASTWLRQSLHGTAGEDLCFFRNSHTRILLAEAERRLGRTTEAMATLRPWLDDAHARGPVVGALMAGARVLEPLAALLAGNDAALLLRLAAQMRPRQAEAPRRPGGLTEREWQVLERIAAGDSNKLIARALDLSLFTVKRHVANIFDKLALSSRTQAAVWLRSRD